MGLIMCSRFFQLISCFLSDASASEAGDKAQKNTSSATDSWITHSPSTRQTRSPESGDSKTQFRDGMGQSFNPPHARFERKSLRSEAIECSQKTKMEAPIRQRGARHSSGVFKSLSRDMGRRHLEPNTFRLRLLPPRTLRMISSFNKFGFPQK